MKYVIGITLLLLVSCLSPRYKYSNTYDGELKPRGENCNFKVVSALPKGDYVEIGVLNLDVHVDFAARDVGTFKEKIRKDVCNSGGDIVVGEVNGRGHYVRGTIFKKK